MEKELQDNQQFLIRHIAYSKKMVDKIPSQDVFFYKSKWTSEIDSLMLSLIIQSKNVGKWDGSVMPYDLLEHVTGALTADTGISYTCRDVYERFRFFEHRYRAFKMVTVKTIKQIHEEESHKIYF
ncbi:hypothetical protein SASPL_123274 [Salvia splendens]|uniref:Uncharacterized protein n=1 Tax=Salvia splendens TaxID=180675 RepID=A0A8X8XL52_SALSN|nr:hypothetical protein SASPL_123274 [Salvia splendens]